MGIFLIELIGSMLLFTSKIYIARKKKIGWVQGGLGISLLAYVYFVKELYVTVVLCIGICLIMIHGYHVLAYQFSHLYKIFLHSLITGITLLFCIFFFFQTLHFENLNEHQLVHALLGLFGSLFLSFNKKYSSITGWVCNILGHIIACYVACKNNLLFIAFFQVVSVIVSLWAIKKEIFSK